jgi:hypothetical protein
LVQEFEFMKPSPIAICRTPSFFLTFAIIFFVAMNQASGQTPTDIQVSGSVVQPSVNRLGINLGDQSFYDSGQMMKNLVFKNPGFEGLMYRVIFHCDAVTANTCTDDNQYNAQPTGYWKGASYRIMTGASAGTTGTITANTNNNSTCAGCGPTLQFDQSVNLAIGDYFSAEIYMPGSGDAGWWDDTGGGGTITTETTDISPESLGKQAILLSASTAGTSTSITQYFDSYSHLSFEQLNGAFSVTFRAKGVGGNNQLNVNVMRIATGSTPYLNQTVTLTNTWQDYTLTFNANETGSALGTVQLVFGAAGSSLELDDVSMQQTNSSASNPTAFQDGVVNALKELNPGTIRMMAAGAALGSDLPNQIQPVSARYRGGFNADGTSVSDVAYGIHEFLQLCQTVGADPWITIPTATTPDEMTEFIEYLTGNGSDAWSALRISRGQVAPWTSVFNKIHLELGNETWNGIFKGESMGFPGYPTWANTVWGAARKAPGFVPAQFELIDDGWSAVAGYNAQMLTVSNQHDSIDIAPYLIFSANDEPMPTMFGALFAEPELFESPGGQVYQDLLAATAVPSATAPTTDMDVYETNTSPIEGTITQTELDEFTPSIGAGLGHTVHMLEMMRLGVKYQNAFALQQYAFVRTDKSIVKLWGVVLDMENTNRRRPTFQTEAIANAVIGGTMLQTIHTGANPTWNQPLSSDNVVLNGAHYLQSFAFLNGTTASVIVFNLNQTAALPVTFSGENVPTGSVTMTQITSANITDNNETASVVNPATQTLSGFSGATGLSLPPYSMTVLSWQSAFAQAPLFSVAAGTYSTTQDVALSTTTTGATIYYTTDGSTPTTSSTQYASPISVSASETINAISVVSGLATSPVAGAAYVIQPVAASPVFSPGAGTYNANQAVALTDVVPESAIYYTTDGSTPTTSSALYTGPVTVNANETISAIAAAANYTNSAVSSAAYVIAPPTPAPTFNVAAGTYTKSQIIQFGDSIPGAVMYYTLDGSTPTTSSTQYSSSVTVTTTATLNAIAVAKGYSASAVTSAAYTIAPHAALPVFSVPGGTYSAAQTLTITDTTPGSSIYYTTDQTTPSTSSPLYTTPITVTGSKYIQAAAIAPGYSLSFITSGTFTINGTAVGTPVFSVPGGTYATAQTVTLSDPTSGAAIYYTTNGTTPTSASTLYTGPVTVTASETLQAIGIKSGLANSSVGSAAYVIGTVAATPVFSLAAGTYSSAQTVGISDATAGAILYYTTDGSVPTTASAVYAGAIPVTTSETISAIAVATNYSNSSVAVAGYTIKTIAATPTFSVASGTYASTQTVSIADSTAGATIYYTTNGTTPTTASAVYSAPITVNTTETLNAIAGGANFTSSAVGSASYTINGAVATPVFSVAAGIYTSAQTVTISDSTAGATIYYTTNGSTPSTSSNLYSGPIAVSATETISAIAIATNYTNSALATASYTINGATATPVFSLAAGTYAAAQTLAISDTTTGAIIYYTTNGTAPSTSSTIYSGPIMVSSSETIEAIAIATNYNNSAVTSASYTINGAVATPIFSLAGGTYTSAQTLSVSDATSGATIYYTTNGEVPTTSSAVYSGPIAVSTSETIKAIAVATSYSNSAVAAATYTINGATATPVFSVAAGSYASAQAVAISAATPGAIIYYTTNGTTPTTSSAVYSGAIAVSSSETIKAIAVATSYSASAVASATYTINGATATPVFSVAAGSYVSTQTVAISDATSGAIIYYTTNGSTPTTSSAVYAGAITINNSETLEAIAVATNYSSSAVASATYTINGATATPVFSVAAGSYPSAQTVAISDATTGAIIYYTTNGSTPTTSSTVYSSAIAVSSSETLKAIAVATSYSSSAVASAAYTINGSTATPVFSVATGSYASAQTVAISDATTGAIIYYTTNGSTPTTSSAVYAGAIAVNSSETINAIAVATNYGSSAVASATYTINGSTSAPVFSVPGGTYSAAQTVAISDATSGAKIYYTTNGTAPTTSATLYSGPLTVSAGETIQAIATASNYNTSSVATAVYVIMLPAAPPHFSVKPGKYTAPQRVTMATSTPKATIHYTTDGSNPTGNSTAYASALTLSSSITLKAVSVASDYSPSPVAEAAYTITTPAAAPTFSIVAGTYQAAQSVVLADATSGAVIYYTIDGTTPTTASTKYTGPISVAGNETIAAFATTSNNNPSAIVTAAYQIAVATPTFSVASGTYTSLQKVSISDSTTGAAIYYTTNGSTPTTTSARYAAPIQVNATEGVKAIAVVTGMTSSSIASASYTIEKAAATPVFSVKAGSYPIAQTVAISDTTTGAVIYYTTNGATPTTSSTKYTAAIKVAASETVKAIAVAANYNNSSIASETYTIEKGAATPVFSVKAGSYPIAQTVAISDTTTGAVIYYTTNGATPTTSSTKYTAAIKVAASETVKAIAVAANYNSSSIASETYTIETAAATPVFSVKAGSYPIAQTVAISDTTTGAVIYYTTNGATPTASSTKYTAAIKVSVNETLKAIAIATNHDESAVATDAIDIQAPEPTFSIAAGSYASAQKVTIADSLAGAAIYYTTNGTTPTTASTKYASAIEVSTTETLKAIAVTSQQAASPVSSAAYTILAASAAPVFSLKAGTYTTLQTLTLTDSTAGAVIYYTTNGSTPTSSSTRYTGPFQIAASETIKAIAVTKGDDPSSVVTNAYVMSTAAPKLSLASGTYTSAETLTITDATPEAVIYYTINGSTPTTGSAKYTAPVNVVGSETVKAIAIYQHFASSAVESATYTMHVAVPKLSVAAGTYSEVKSLTITDDTAGAMIYYTTNGTTPTTSSTKYTGSISLQSDETVKAFAVYQKFTASSAVSAAYTIVVAIPQFSVASGTYTSTQTLKITDSTAGAVLYYTLDGTTPTTASAKYTAPITIKSSTIVRVLAAFERFRMSTGEVAYTLVAANPNLSVASGTYASPQTLTITDATPGATIYYTTNGASPSMSSSRYVGPISVGSAETIKAIAIYGLFHPSGITSASYTLEAAQPGYSIASGTYSSEQKVTISDPTPGATIYYTTNGTEPTTASTKYSVAIAVQANTTIKAIAVKTGYTTSAVSAATYVMEAAIPTFSVASGSYSAIQSVTIGDQTSGAIIYYTTNGSTPTTASTRYTGAIAVKSSQTIHAIAIVKNMSNSPIAAVTYTIKAGAQLASTKGFAVFPPAKTDDGLDAGSSPVKQ